MAGIEGFYSTLVATCFFNTFLLFTSMVLNIITIQALRKIPSFPKPLKTFLISLAVSDLGVGLLVHPLYIARLLIEVEQSANQRLYNTVYTAHGLFANLLLVYRLIVGHFRFNCRPILSYSSSSQIPGTCDIQTCCCCSNFSLGVQFMYFLICVEHDFRKRFGHHNYNFWGSLSHYNGINLLQDIFNRTSPHKSASPAIAGSITESEWRNGKCCKAEKNWTCYILRVCRVFGFSSTLPLRQNGYSNVWWVCLADASASLFNDTGVSKFIPQSSDLLLEDEKHSASCEEWAMRLHFLPQKKIRNFISRIK